MNMFNQVETKTNELLRLIETEVRASFTNEEIKAESFESFFSLVDCQNAYEEDWQPAYYKPFYFVVFNKLKREVING